MKAPASPVLSSLNPSRSLKARMGLATVGIVLLLSLSLSGIAGHISRTEIEESRGEFLESLSFQMADKLERGLFERYRDIQILASLDAIRDPKVAMSSKRTLIEKLQSTYPDYAWIGLTDDEGNVLASTGGLLEGKNAAKRPWFQEAQQQPFAGDVHEALLLAKLLENPTGEPLRFVDLAAPVMTEAGELEGILSAHLSWSWAREVKQSLLAPLEQLNQVEILILSQDGRVLLGPDGMEDELLNLPSVKAGQSGKTGYQLETWPDQAEYLTGFAPSQGYRDYPGLGWTTLIRQPAEVAFLPARSLQRQVFAWGAILGGLCAVGSWLNARRVVNPILQLTQAVNRIQQGDVHGKIPIIRGRDELARFSGSLAHLVQTLNQQQQDLAATNQQLQQEMLERQRSHQKLQEQAALLDIATDAIFVRDLNGNIQYWNHSAAEIYGWSAEEVRGQEAAALLNPAANASQLSEIFKSVLAQGEWQGQLTKVTRSGKEVIIDSRWTLVRDESNEPTAILTVDTDVTQAKQLEAQFLRAQRLESLGTLASGIAHDLNNVLTPILGTAAMLPVTLKNMDSTSERLIQSLDISARRASDMVKQILSFARGGEGPVSSVQVTHLLVELRQVIHSALPKDISIQLDLPQELWLVSVDATQFHQVLMNLCVNARDAMAEGGTLTLAAENLWIDEHYQQLHIDAKVGPYIRVVVSDTGMGMSAEVIERIFDPFFTTKEIGKGTGLGLSTVIGIVKSHGGFVTVYSEPGRGTKFSVYLPAQASSSIDAEESAPAPLGHGEMILVVDDEKLIQEITKTALESYDYRVITASDGNEAVNQYHRYGEEIEVVLMDMMMPMLGGNQAIDQLRQISPEVKVIATSGLAMQESAADVEAFLPKPYSIRILLEALEQAIHH